MGNYVDITDCTERLYTVLDRVGYLSIKQAERINYNNVLADAAIRELCKTNRAFLSENKKFILRQPWRKPFYPVVNAVDVMLAFLMNIDIHSIFVKQFIAKTDNPDEKEELSAFNPANDRMLLGFARGKRIYEIYLARNKDELHGLYDYLKIRHQNYLDNGGDNEGIRYLIMVTTESLFLYETKDVPYLYAFAYLDPDTHEPTFYNPLAVDIGENEGED